MPQSWKLHSIMISHQMDNHKLIQSEQSNMFFTAYNKQLQPDCTTKYFFIADRIFHNFC